MDKSSLSKFKNAYSKGPCPLIDSTILKSLTIGLKLICILKYVIATLFIHSASGQILGIQSVALPNSLIFDQTIQHD